MSIKRKLQFNRVDFTYESEEGESYGIVYVDSEDREYFEITLIDKDSGSPNPDTKKVYDVKMWEEILEERNKIKKPPEVIKVNKDNLPKPRISDFRNSPVNIQEQVNTTMENTEDSMVPLESFSQVGNTPAEWQYNEDENASWHQQTNASWQEQAKARPKVRPQYRSKGHEGFKFKRVGAEELI